MFQQVFAKFIGLALGMVVLLALAKLGPVGAVVCLVLYLLFSAPYIVRGIANAAHIKPVLSASSALVRYHYAIGIASALYLAGVYGLPLLIAVLAAALTTNSLPAIKSIRAYNPRFFWTVESFLLWAVCVFTYAAGGVKIDPMATGEILFWVAILVPLSLLTARTVAVASVITEMEQVNIKADEAARQYLVNNGITPTSENVRLFIQETPEFFDKLLQASNTKYNFSLEALRAIGHGNSLFRFVARAATVFLILLFGPVMLMVLPAYIAFLLTAARYHHLKPTAFSFVRGTQVVKG